MLDGFRLGCRPVSRRQPPGRSGAGNHLGGVDVDVRVIDGTEAAGAAEAVMQELDAGLTAVVVIASDRTARAVTTELEGAGGDRDRRWGQRPGRCWRAPTAAALRAAVRVRNGRRDRGGIYAGVRARPHRRGGGTGGYDAGRLLDAAIAAADNGIEDLDSVVAAGSAVDDVLISQTSPRPTGTGRQWPTVAVGAVAVLALLAALFGWRARNDRRRAG